MSTSHQAGLTQKEEQPLRILTPEWDERGALVLDSGESPEEEERTEEAEERPSKMPKAERRLPKEKGRPWKAEERPEEDAEMDNGPKVMKSAWYECHECDMTFRTMKGRNGHMKGHSGKPQCRRCGQKFPHRANYAYHLKVEHRRMHKCKMCGFEDKDADRVLGHILTHSEMSEVAVKVYKQFE